MNDWIDQRRTKYEAQRGEKTADAILQSTSRRFGQSFNGCWPTTHSVGTSKDPLNWMSIPRCS
jgi:hypothetical protein